jgi:hypothetical protein
MGEMPMPVRDHLELWRGIDDAVWREAARPVQPAPRRVTATVPRPAREQTVQAEPVPAPDLRPA